jgi:hypothetical protein
MPGFDPITLALGGVQAIPQVLAAIKQKKLANRLKVQDTQPAAFKEQLAGLRLGANTARLPGMGAAEDKLAQNFAAGAGAAVRGGGSSADVLAGINALSLNRQAGQSQLTTQGVQSQDAAKQHLNSGLSQQAAYQSKDLADFSRNKAALIQSSNQNLQNALGTIAGAGALAHQQATGGTSAPAAGSYGPGIPGLDTFNFPQVPGNSTPAYGVGLSNYGAVRRKQRSPGVY